MNNLKSFVKVIGKLWFILNKEQRRKSIVMFGLSLINGVLEMLGVAIIVPFLYALLNPKELRTNVLVSKGMQIFLIETDFGMMVMLGAFVVLVYIIKNLLIFLYSYVKVRVGSTIEKELSLKVLDTYLAKPYTFFLDTNAAEVLRGFNSDISGSYQVLDQVFGIFISIFKIICISAFLIITSAIMAIGVLIVMALLMYISIGIFRPRMRLVGLEQRNASLEQSKWGMQAVYGIKDIKVTNRSEHFMRHYEKAAAKRQKATVISGAISAIPSPVLETVTILGMMIVVVLGLYLNSDMDKFITACASFALGAMRILPSVSAIIGGLNNIAVFKPALDATYKNLHEIKDAPCVMENVATGEQKAELSMKEKISLRNIWWKYPNSDRYVLRGIDLDIYKGESVALIGASGAGKTTLADIILGLLIPEKGSIQLDGIDISAITAQWSTLVGYVPQMVYLLDDTVRNNILFGLESEGDDKIWKALEQAQLKDFVEGLPDQLDTVIGDRGVKFSGGQRQRVAIARVLYYNPEILVLDEATSALDTETENSVMESIEMLQGKKTMIIVAHRLETIRKCDRIFAIENDKIYQKTHEEVFGN